MRSVFDRAGLNKHHGQGNNYKRQGIGDVVGSVFYGGHAITETAGLRVTF